MVPTNPRQVVSAFLVGSRLGARMRLKMPLPSSYPLLRITSRRGGTFFSSPQISWKALSALSSSIFTVGHFRCALMGVGRCDSGTRLPSSLTVDAPLVSCTRKLYREEGCVVSRCRVSRCRYEIGNLGSGRGEERKRERSSRFTIIYPTRW